MHGSSAERGALSSDMTSPPQWSFASASRPEFAPRPVTMGEALKAIIAWLRGRKPTLREQIKAAKLVERIAAEIEEEERRR
jgi:hypothetical protein